MPPCSPILQALPESQRPLPLSLVRALDTSTHVMPHYGLTGGSTTSEQVCGSPSDSLCVCVCADRA